MSYKESYGRAAAIAKEVLEQMDSLQIASHPDNFEIWYAFHAGIDAELSRQLSGMLESVDEFDPHSYQDIKQSYLGEDASQIIQDASESVEDTLAKPRPQSALHPITQSITARSCRGSVVISLTLRQKKSKHWLRKR